MMDFRSCYWSNTMGQLSHCHTVQLPLRAHERMPADGQAFWNDAGGSQFKYRWQDGAHHCVLRTFTQTQTHRCCTNKWDFAAYLRKMWNAKLNMCRTKCTKEMVCRKELMKEKWMIAFLSVFLTWKKNDLTENVLMVLGPPPPPILIVSLPT